MNSLSVCIGILVKSNISKLCLIKFLNQVSSSALRKYLGAAEVYDGNANKKKSDLIEMIVDGFMNGKLKSKIVEDILFKRVLTTLKEHNTTIKSLLGNGKMRLRKKDIKTCVKNKSNEKSSVNIPLE